jgi:hypothetical protein
MRATLNHVSEPQGWQDRIASARNKVAGARSLDELADVLNSPHFAALPLTDLAVLPTFGGERPAGTGVFSWDPGRVLVMNEIADGFELRRR